MFHINEDSITCVNEFSRDYSPSLPEKEELLRVLEENRQLKDLLITFMHDIGHALAGEASNLSRLQRPAIEEERAQK